MPRPCVIGVSSHDDTSFDPMKPRHPAAGLFHPIGNTAKDVNGSTLDALFRPILISALFEWDEVSNTFQFVTPFGSEWAESQWVVLINFLRPPVWASSRLYRVWTL